MTHYALSLAKRLKTGKKGDSRSSLSCRIAVISIAIASAVMLLTLAIVTGFKAQITDKIIGFDSQISISPQNGDDSSSAIDRLPPELIDQLNNTGLQSATINGAIVQPGLLKTEDDFTPVIIRAYGNDKDYGFLTHNIVEGWLPDFSSDSTRNDIVISATQANALRLECGDKVNAAFFIDNNIKVRRYTIAAIYRSNFSEYDDVIAFGNPASVKSLQKIDTDQWNRYEIAGLPLEQLPEATERINTVLRMAYFSGSIDQPLIATSILTTGAVYFNWLQMLDTNVVVIITLMAIIALFTLISALFILILERVKLIGTLKTIGASNNFIRSVFIALTTKLLLKGLLIGNLTALGVIFLQTQFHLLPLDPDSYYISFVPMEISVVQIIILNLAAIAAALLAMLIPAAIISRISPAQTVRFE